MPDKPTKFISLGAGVQSTTLLLMAAKGELGDDPPRYAIFADTGWEPRHVYEHLDWLEEEAAKYGVTVIRAAKGNLKEDFLYGMETGKRAASIPFYVKNPEGKREGMLWRQCTKEYKIDVVRKEIRRLLGYKPRQRIKEQVELWMGISTDEIQRVKPSQVKFIVNKYPLIDIGFSRQDCIDWMKKHGYPEPPKSSCIGCPYHDDAYWLNMKQKYPEEFTEAVEYDRSIRNHPKVNGELYLHRSCVPLDQVEFDPGEKIDYFTNECEGMCGL